MYIIAGHQFKTKKDIKQRVKMILKNGLTQESEEIIKGLIKWHPTCDAEDPVITIGINDYNHRQFLCNGRPFSIYKCIRSNTKEGYHRTNVIKAFRQSIRGQINEFRESKCSKGYYICEISGNMYTKDEIHCDHDYEKLPFRVLIKQYMNETKQTLDSIELINKKNGGW